MIGFTKLLCGKTTVSDIIRHSQSGDPIPAAMLQFSSDTTPIVVWNTTARCNLYCRHCYIRAEDREFESELSTAEGKALIDDLAKMKVPVLLFSGGEPLLRPDLFELAAYAGEKGLRPVLSTNGTLIDDAMAKRIKETGFQYVGVSIDGNEATHDSFRGLEGAFDAAIAGIRAARAAGNKTGVRFTINRLNAPELAAVFDIAEKEGIDRFCMYHLVYAGRGSDMAALDLSKEDKRKVADFLIEKTLDFERRGVDMEILTTDNHVDGLCILQYVEKNQPERADEVRKLLAMHGGCSAGDRVADVDPEGNVHPCQFWSDLTLGNVRETPFSEIWKNREAGGIIDCLRHKPEHLIGKCGTCRYNDVCGGCRIRAESAGELWGEDPACYWPEEDCRKLSC